MGLRQRFLLIFSFVFAFALFPNSAYAESHNSLSGVAETIEELFGFIPNIITLEKLLGEDAAAMFWARFLLWVLLFAVFYYGGSFAFKVGDKVNGRIAGTVAFVFASISALLIPEKIITGIFQSYGLLSAILIWFVPVMAGFFLVSNIQPRPMKALIYLGMIFVLVAIDKSITSNFATDLADTVWFAFFKLLLAVVIIAFLWNLLFAGVEGWNAGVPGGGHGGGGHDDGNQPVHNPPHLNPPNPNPPHLNPPNPNPPHLNPPNPNPPGPDRRRDQREMVLETEIWKLMKKLRDNEHIGHLIDECKNGESIAKVRAVLSQIDQINHILERLGYKEIEAEEREERIHRLRTRYNFDEHKITNELLNLIEQERNLFNHYNGLFLEIRRGIIDAINGGHRNMPDAEVKAHWQHASNTTLLAMRVLELLIRINAMEINRLDRFSETRRV